MYLTIFGKPRYLGLIVAEDEEHFEKGDRLLVESSRGLEIAIIAGEITEHQKEMYRSIDNRQDGQPSSDSGLQNLTFIRRVDARDLENEAKNRDDEGSVLIKAREVLSNHDLDMKLVDVEYMNDRKKLFLYFTSEQRVDFRAYVRDLAREFRTRIELRQIGVRDEAKVVKGIGACGRRCCCSYWLQRFMPIGIRMVKEQNLALNPTKISGLCGRLMCCMSFEQSTYHELWKTLPAHGAKIKTEEGNWVLLGVNLATKTCSIHGPEGTVNIPVGMYQSFKETILSGQKWSNEAHGLDEKGRPLSERRDEDFPEIPYFKNIRSRGCAGCLRLNRTPAQATQPQEKKETHPQEPKPQPASTEPSHAHASGETKHERHGEHAPHQERQHPHRVRRSRPHAPRQRPQNEPSDQPEKAAEKASGEQQRVRRPPRRRPHRSGGSGSGEQRPQKKIHEKVTDH